MSATTMSGRPSSLTSAASTPIANRLVCPVARAIDSVNVPLQLLMVEEVVLLEIVGDVDVRAAVEVQVAHDEPEPEPFAAAIDAGGGADVDEVAAVVAVQPPAAARGAHVALAARRSPARRASRS